MRHELGVIPGAFLEVMRLGVNMLTQPPLSGESSLPGINGSYLADEA
jgi:hypothetical protein